MMRRAVISSLAVFFLSVSTASAFVLNNPITRWPDGAFTVNTQITHPSLGAVSMSGTSWNDGFVQALDAWNTAAGLGTLVDLGANPGVFEDPCELLQNQDGIHGVGFNIDFCGVPWGQTTLAVARTFMNGGLATEGNIVFREDAMWDIVAGNQLGSDDFRRVAVHEIGHLLGLDHPPGSNAIMFASVQDGVELPQADDIQGIQAVYQLGCPVFTNAVAGSINGSLDATDCLDTESVVPLPTMADCNLITFEANSFVDLYRVSLPPGTNLGVTMTSTEFNPAIQVLNTALDTEFSCDWNNNSGNPATLSLALAPGDYVVAARSVFAGSGFAYNLVLAPEAGGVALALGVLGALGLIGNRRSG